MTIMKYLFVDGNNLGCRASFVFRNLAIDLIDYTQDFNPDSIGSSKGAFPTGAMHGFLRNIAAVRRAYPDRYVVVVWDGKSKVRIAEAREAAEKGIVPSGYKANRPENARSPEVASFHQQKPVIMDALSLTNIPQIVQKDEEADDVVASFVTAMPNDDILVMTNDKDYYQLFGSNMKILESGGSIIDEAWFRNAYGISPEQWVDVGALQGDDGDNIWGIPWVGEGTALKMIASHGTCEAALAASEAEFGPIRQQFPDIRGEEFAALKAVKTKATVPGTEKIKYPYIKEWMPYTGVALAYENNKVKIPRGTLMTLVYQARIPVAKKLKAMRRMIKLPKLPVDLGRTKVDEFMAICRKYGLREVESSATTICSKQALS